MKKRKWAKWTSVFAVTVFAVSLAFAGDIFAQEGSTKAPTTGEMEIKGKVKAVSNKAKTLSVTIFGKENVDFRFLFCCPKML